MAKTNRPTAYKAKGEQKQPEKTKRNNNNKKRQDSDFSCDVVENCPVCNEAIVAKGIQCDLCNSWVHQCCANLSGHEYETISRMNNEFIKFFCPPCSQSDSKSSPQDIKLNTLVGIVKSLQSQNEAILAVVGKLDQKIDSKVEEKLNTCLKEKKEETREKEDRENNLIIFNLPESDDSDEAETTKDKSQVNDLFLAIGSDLTDHKFEDSTSCLKRLGRKMAGKIRPIKVSFKETVNKHIILRKARNLKGSSRFSKVGISEDKTLTQREEDRKLRVELKLRKEKGEDVVIFKGAIIERKREADHSNDAFPNTSS